ncbi:hypothetical protein BB559_004732 [Furculomyces boomerangus]|uniref:GH16 domain-containing protein n=1 Tax=Furculomyces boomerangus TaxID=61424 RepID=A0A2T9YD10_9FUNG|nr:hypothetical protein BB559_004732 [Furculomyces boomerangus]
MVKVSLKTIFLSLFTAITVVADTQVPINVEKRQNAGPVSPQLMQMSAADVIPSAPVGPSVQALAAPAVCGSLTYDFSTQTTLGDLSVEWNPANVKILDGSLQMGLTQSAGCTVRYSKQFIKGKAEAYIKMAPRNGAVSAFILYGDTIKDEVDIEWLGRDHFTIQTMYFINGQKVVGDTAMYSDSPDPATGNFTENYHKYGIELTDTEVNWYIDDVLVRKKVNTDPATFPSKANTVKFGVWNASGVDNGVWSGLINWNYMPKIMYMKSLNIQHYC